MEPHKGYSLPAGGIKLAAVDMDGTFLTNKKVFTEHSRRVLQAAIDRGILVVPATGRGFFGLTDKLLGLTGVHYVISADGAYVTDCETHERVWEQTIPCEAAARLADELLTDGNCVYYHRDDPQSSHIMACASQEIYRRNFWRRDFPAPETIITEGFGDYIRSDGKNVPKMGLLFSRADGFEHYGKLLSEEYPQLNYFRADDTLIEITSHLTDKGTALRSLAERLGIPREQILAIGDNGNDVSMLKYAGVGVAMGNALEPVRAIADYVAATNEEEGAAAFLEEFLQLKSD